MKFEISNVEEIYHILKNPPLSSEELEHFEYVRELNEHNQFNGEPSMALRKGVSIDLGEIPLPSPPLKKAEFSIIRNHIDNYAVLIKIGTSEDSPIKELSQVMGSRFGKNWVSNDRNGGGYFISPEKEAIVSIFYEDSNYNICAGCRGATPLKLGSLEDFQSNVNNLEKVMTSFTNSCLSTYKKNLKSRERKTLEKYPDVSVYFSG
jgi:hypothetical protein|tara:strand:+ start:455 stop:1072 length:618 start_codon:yes stop_codon:yes gene_type:complete